MIVAFSKKSRKFFIAIVVTLLVAFSALSECFPTIVYAYETTDEAEKLYYGYNVIGGKDLAEPDALQTSAPIIDPNSDYGKYIKKFSGSKQDASSFIAESISSLASKYASEVSANVFGKIYVVDADVSAAFDLSKKSVNTYSEQYELYSTYITRYYYIVQKDASEIRDYLSEQFKEDLAAVKTENAALALFEKYGTHLNTGYSFGGRLNISNYKTTSDSSLDFSRSKALNEKVSAVLSKVQAGESASITEEYSSLENDATSTSTYKFVSYGGVATSGLTLDGLFTYNASITDGDKAGFMYTRWINSINNDQDLAIIGIPNGAKSIPLWDLLDDSEDSSATKDILLRAYLQLCGENYDAYLQKYPEIVRNIAFEDRDSNLPTFNGAYIETPEHYFYYVEEADFASSGDHYAIHNGDYVYLDLTSYSDLINADYFLQNGEIVDKKSAIFKVTGNSGLFVINIKCGDNSTKLLSIPIVENLFEGGTGKGDYPYIITNGKQFKNISSDTAANYLLVCDIDFNGESISAIRNFSGVLDGNYCKISNFTIKSAQNWGLFSQNSGTIKNLSISDAGTCVARSSFKSDGYDYVSEEYSNDSIQAVNAGIICGENKGTIDNCCVQSVYIRNIIVDSDVFLVNSSITMATGAIAGTNTGTITNTMASNCNILTAYVCNGDKNENTIQVYSGGFVGQLTGGIISSCVADSASEGTVFSQSVNPYKVRANAINQVFATMFIGYCNSSASVENSYVFVRNTPGEDDIKAINVRLVFGSKIAWWDNKPNSFSALRCASIVCGDNVSITSNSINVFSADEKIMYYAITPTQNGDNSDGSTASFSICDKVPVTELKIDGETDFRNTALSDFSFSYKAGAMSSSSKIIHLLSQNRSQYIKLGIDETQNQMRTDYYVNECFTPVGLQVLRYIGNENEMLKVFTLSAQGGNSTIAGETLTSTEEKIYSVTVSAYDQQISADSIPLVVRANAISSIYVDESVPHHVYYDRIHEYYENFSAAGIGLKAILTGGETIDISENPGLFEDSKTSITTSEDSLIAGKNIIGVQFDYNNKQFETSFVLEVEKREIQEIKILQMPTKTEYLVGQTVSLNGMQVEIVYEVGDSVLLKTGEQLDQLEITGKTVGLGRNSVAITYGRYSNAAYFEVLGKATSVTENEESAENETTLNVNDEESGRGKIILRLGLYLLLLIAFSVIAIVIIRVYKKKKAKISVAEMGPENSSEDNRG